MAQPFNTTPSRELTVKGLKPKPLITEEELELLTTPRDLMEYKNSITDALYKGTKRNVQSEDDAKNAVVE